MSQMTDRVLPKALTLGIVAYLEKKLLEAALVESYHLEFLWVYEPIDWSFLLHAMATPGRGDSGRYPAYDLLGKRVNTPAGEGKVVQVYADQVDVVLDGDRNKIGIFGPWDVQGIVDLPAWAEEELPE